MEKKLEDIDFTARDIADVTRSVQDYYLRQGYQDRKNLATPRFLLPLIDYLEANTEFLTQELEDSPGAMESQTALDLAHWKMRLAAYRAVLASAPIDNGSAIATAVTGPLLLGWYPGEESQRMLDVVTPVRILHTIQANTAAMDEAWSRLGADLTKAYADAAESAAEATSKAAEAAREAGSWIFDPDKPRRLLLIPAAIVAVVGTVGGIALAVRSKVL